MTVIEFLSALRRLDIRVWVSGERLCFSAPPGAITPGLQHELSTRKSEIISFLKKAKTGALSAPPPIHPVPRNRELPLSFAQQRLWFLDQLDPGSPLYNVAYAFRLVGRLDRPALERALNALVDRHEVLRSSFPTLDGRPVQHIVQNLQLLFAGNDVTNASGEEREPAVGQLALAEAQRPFDLAKGPLARARLLRLEEADHVLLFTLHHIVSDGWSRAIFCRELAALYQAFVAGHPSSLAPMPIQYADFAVWQRQWLQGDVLRQQLDYWKEKLAGHLPVLELPFDRPRPVIQTFRGARETFPLSRSLAEALHHLSQREGATLFMTLLAALQALLHRYSNQDDIIVGFPVAGRNSKETEGLIGFFVNTLVLRARCSNDPTFRELLSQVRDEALGAYAHQDLPFEKLIDELKLERNLSHNALFQVMFVFQQSMQERIELPGLTVSPMEWHTGTAKFDLTFTVTRDGEQLKVAVDYNSDLFDAPTIIRCLGHYRTLLEGIANVPEQRISSLPMLTSEERQRLLVEWNATQVTYPRLRRLHELFAEQVERTPDAAAIIFEDTTLTYRELDYRSNQVGNRLRSLGVGADQLVGICMERSIEMVVGLLGILKTGGAYVPLDPEYPKERLAFMLADARTRVLLTQKRLVENIPSLPANTFCLDTNWEDFARESSAPLGELTSAANLAYMIYTSGSTGQPKGALNTHQAICNRLLWMQDEYHLTNADAVLQKTPFSFDVSVWEFFWPLITGARLIMARPGGHKEPNYLIDLIVRQSVTVMHFVPSMLSAFLEEPYVERCSSLRDVICSGEALPFELQERFFERLQANLHNLYGPTEAAVDVTFWRCQRQSQRKIVPIGSPVANTQTYILDAHLQPVPIGIAGELHLAGVQVGRGYHNRPELTAEKFIPAPFSDTPGARFYKTGDLCRYLWDGTIDYLGRMDHQVKIRGFRIELGEIESVLRQHPNVRDGVVVARSERPGEKQLVAYVVLQSSQTASVKELRSFLKEKLPDYMVPVAFLFLEALPQTPNGKVDRKALPSPEPMRSKREEALETPHTPVEQELARIWAEVLRFDRVGIHDNFFELGGDSILSIQIIAKAGKVGVHLTPKQLFQHQTIAELAGVAGAIQVRQADQGLITGSVPLTPIQCWFFENELPHPEHWNMSFLVEAADGVEAATLEKAARHLLLHHDALRLRFVKSESGWKQVLSGEEAVVPVSRVDLSRLPVLEQDASFKATAQELQAGLDLSKGPLMRIAIFHSGRQQPDRMLVVVHHLVVDGVSRRILIEDLQTAYSMLCRGAQVQLSAKTTSFQRWAEQLCLEAQSPAYLGELSHWLEQSWAGRPSLPTDFPAGPEANTDASERTITVALEALETQALLKEALAAHRVQINDVLLMALARAFSTWTGARSLRIDLEGHGREPISEDLDVSRTVGWFTTLFPVIISLGDNHSQGECLKLVKEQMRLVPRRGFGFGLFRYLSSDPAIHKPLRHIPPAQVLFNYLGQFDQLATNGGWRMLAGEPIGAAHSPEGVRNYQLEISALIVGGRLQVGWAFSENLHRRDTIEELANNFITELRALIFQDKPPASQALSPTDFPLLNLNQRKLDKILARAKRLDLQKSK